MSKIINLYDKITNDNIGQLFLYDEPNQKYNYNNENNDRIGQAIRDGSEIIIQNNKGQDIYKGQFHGDRIDFLSLERKTNIYGIKQGS